ncbi:MAG: glycine cleavage system regulatory protein [Motiliproteus sp.]|jgi:glycine cleavage system regulatory protein
MQTTLILTLIGEDRPGLVELVSQLIAGRQGQWLESQFSRLEGKFAGVLHIRVPADQRAALEGDLDALAEQGLRVVVEQGTPAAVRPCYPLTLSFVGLDRRNVIAEISEVLSRFGVTIRNLKSHCAPAPMSAEILFHADLDVQVPISVSCDQLSDALEALTPELMVDLDAQGACAV